MDISEDDNNDACDILIYNKEGTSPREKLDSSEGTTVGALLDYLGDGFLRDKNDGHLILNRELVLEAGVYEFEEKAIKREQNGKVTFSCFPYVTLYVYCLIVYLACWFSTVFRASGFENSSHQSVPKASSSASIINADGINFESKVVLYRQGLVDRVIAATMQDHGAKRFLVLGAPPAYGKTSLLQLLGRECDSRNVLYQHISAPQGGNFQQIAKHFCDLTGIDLYNERIEDRSPGNRNRTKLIMIDDAHQLYHIEAFWIRLFKSFPRIDGSSKFRFIFAVTYNLRIGGSPVSFNDPTVARIGAEEFFLTPDESKELWTMYLHQHKLSAWKVFDQLQRSIILDCGGQVGVITATFAFLKNKQENYGGKMTESDLLRLIFNCEHLDSNLDRCFDLPLNVAEPVVKFLAKIYISGTKDSFTYPSEAEKMYLRHLIRGGVLTAEEQVTGGGGNFQFTTPVAKRVYYRHLFPNCASYGTVPQSVDDLVISAIKRFRSGSLTNAAHASGSAQPFPKEAAFQHLLMTSLAAELPSSAAVCPEMSRSWGKFHRLNCNQLFVWHD